MSGNLSLSTPAVSCLLSGHPFSYCGSNRGLRSGRRVWGGWGIEGGLWGTGEDCEESEG